MFRKYPFYSLHKSTSEVKFMDSFDHLNNEENIPSIYGYSHSYYILIRNVTVVILTEQASECQLCSEIVSFLLLCLTRLGKKVKTIGPAVSCVIRTGNSKAR